MNRIFCLLLLCGVSFSLLSAQGISVAEEAVPRISIDKWKWEKWTQFPVMNDFNSGYDASNPRVNSSAPSGSIFPPGGLRTFYVYQASFKNNAERDISGIVWDYVFVDPTNNQEIGRHRFASYAKIKSGESKKIADKDFKQPTRVISAQALEKNARSPYLERVEIKCVQFRDEAMWTEKTMKKHECERLRFVVKHKYRPRMW